MKFATLRRPHATKGFFTACLQGHCLLLKKFQQDKNVELLQKLSRCCLIPEAIEEKGPQSLFYYEVEKAVNLIRNGSSGIKLT
jgi:hypothetical protein